MSPRSFKPDSSLLSLGAVAEMMARTPPQLSPEPTLGERFGLNLWRSRRRADLSQEALANLVGLSRPHIGVVRS